MLLVVDVGNSETAFGLYEQRKLLCQWVLETNVSRTADEYAAFLLPLWEREEISILKTIRGMSLCSVVPPADRALEHFSKKYLDRSPVKIQASPEWLLRLNVANPLTVGADRIANAAYALEHLSLPAIIIDLGTATTFDVISKQGTYDGGAILPGVGLAFESLGSKTSKLPYIAPEFPESVVGKTTAECIQAGILFGYCEQIDGLIRRISQSLPTFPKIALTGGYAPLFSKKLNHPIEHIPTLTLDGICLLTESTLV